MNKGTQTDRDKDKTYDQSGTEQTGTMREHDQDDKSGTKYDRDKKSGTKKSSSDQGDRMSGTDKTDGKKKVNEGDKGTTVTTYTHTPTEQDKDKKDKKYRKDMDRDKTDVSIRDRDRDRDWDNDQDDDVSVPDKVRNAFSNAYTNAKASWKREGNNFRALFRNDRDKDALTTIVVYDKDGNVLVTERELKNTNCPEEIEKFCSRNKRVWKVETKNAPVKYLIQEEDETEWYDSKGNRIGGSDRDVGVIGDKPYEK